MGPTGYALLGALLGAAVGITGNWIAKPDWTEHHPGRVVLLVIGLALVSGLVAAAAGALADRESVTAAPPGGSATSGAAPPATPEPAALVNPPGPRVPHPRAPAPKDRPPPHGLRGRHRLRPHACRGVPFRTSSSGSRAAARPGRRRTAATRSAPRAPCCTGEDPRTSRARSS